MRRALLTFLLVPVLLLAGGPRRGKRAGRAVPLNPAQRNTLLYEHNRVRRAVGVGPLVWSSTLSVYAQAWADHLAATSCELHHRSELNRRDGREYGENLAAQGSTARDEPWNPATGVRDWEAEKKDYHGGPLGAAWHAAGHYTQVVWRASRRVGCGHSVCRKGEWTWHLLVCNYDPPGNYMGRKPY